MRQVKRSDGIVQRPLMDAEHGTRVSLRRIERNGLLRAFGHAFGLRKPVQAWRINGGIDMRFGERRPARSEPGIDGQCFFQPFDRLRQHAVADGAKRERAPLQIEFVSRLALRHPTKAGQIEYRSQFARHGPGDIFLQGENILNRSAIPLRPILEPGRTVNQAHIDAHDIALTLNRALNEV